MQQRLVLMLPFTPNGKVEEHPGIVLTDNEFNNFNGAFLAVMMTTKNHGDQYTFEINDDMLSHPLEKEHSEVRTHIVEEFDKSKVKGKQNCYVNEATFEIIVERILEQDASLKEILDP